MHVAYCDCGSKVIDQIKNLGAFSEFKVKCAKCGKSSWCYELKYKDLAKKEKPAIIRSKYN